MSTYVKGKYRVNADVDKFQKTIDLKYKLQLVAGFYQNDMEVCERDLQEVEDTIKYIHQTLMNDFENTLDTLNVE